MFRLFFSDLIISAKNYLATSSSIRNAFAPYRGRNPQNREKRVSESKNPHFPPPQKRVFRVKNPHVYTERYKENGDFLTRNTLFWGGGKWGFLDSETLFPRFWGFRPLSGANAFLTVAYFQTK